MDVSRSLYYNWLKNPISKKQEEDQKLAIIIKQIFLESRGTYGHRRIKKQLRKHGINCNNERFRRIMRENGLISIHKSKFKATTNSNHKYPITPNLLQKDFSAAAPNQKWVGDITYIPTDEGWLYLAAVVDLYHRKVVGWAISDRMTKQLTLDTI